MIYMNMPNKSFGDMAQIVVTIAGVAGSCFGWKTAVIFPRSLCPPSLQLT